MATGESATMMVATAPETAEFVTRRTIGNVIAIPIMAMTNAGSSVHRALVAVAAK
jgi:hypothetical protein